MYIYIYIQPCHHIVDIFLSLSCAASHFFGDSVSPVALVEILVAAGCDLNVSDKHGWTPLYQAAFSGETGQCVWCPMYADV